MTDELAYTERLDRQIDALMRRAEKADARIIELERREALLTAFVLADDRTQRLEPRRWRAELPDELWAAVNVATDARLALDWVPHPDSEDGAL